MRQRLIVAAATLVTVPAMSLWAWRSEPIPSVAINDQTVRVEVVSSPEARARGLGGRESLDTDEGMLFIFDTPAHHSIWMAEMRFAIDIIWIGEDNRVVDIAANVEPSSYPSHFTPDEPAKYVLEVPAGTAAARGWQAGQPASFEL